MPKEDYFHRLAERSAELVRRGVPERFVDAEIEDFPKVDRLARRRSAFVTGGVGVGKTRLIVSILKEYVRAGESNVRFQSVPLLFAEIRDTFGNPNKSELALIRYYSQIPVLALDDLGAEKVSDWTIQTLYMIIDQRWLNNRTTLISSNYQLKELSGKLGDRITSRISDLCHVIRLGGKDRRK